MRFLEGSIVATQGIREAMEDCLLETGLGSAVQLEHDHCALPVRTDGHTHELNRVSSGSPEHPAGHHRCA